MPRTHTAPPKPTKCTACQLKTLKCFRSLDEDEVKFLSAFKSGEFVAEPGASILQEGTRSPHLYTILSGWAFRYKLLPDGRRQILNFAMPGDLLGLQSSVFSEMKHSVEALSHLVLCVFPRERLWELYAHYPALAFDVTWLVARSERLLDESLLSVGRRSARERIAHLLLLLFHRASALEMTQGRRLTLPFTQQHLADALGLSLVHTNKTLKTLSEHGCIRWKDGRLEILDEKGLAALADYESDTVQPRPIL